MIRSSSLCRSTLDDSFNVYFAFFGVAFHFLGILEVYNNFWKFNWLGQPIWHARSVAHVHGHRTPGAGAARDSSSVGEV
jgi:hypothetical protein